MWRFSVNKYLRKSIMKIYVDADACPVVAIVEQIAKEYEIPVTLLCDTNHVLYSDYSDGRSRSRCCGL